MLSSAAGTAEIQLYFLIGPILKFGTSTCLHFKLGEGKVGSKVSKVNSSAWDSLNLDADADPRSALENNGSGSRSFLYDLLNFLNKKIIFKYFVLLFSLILIL